MARRNRLECIGGIYHVTSRTAGKIRYFNKPAIKDKFVEMMYRYADALSVNVLAFSVMDNHIHMLVYVPSVPKEYWLDSSIEPKSNEFARRPSIVAPYLLSQPLASNGDTPQSLGYDLPDDVFQKRLAFLYNSEKRAAKMISSWNVLKEKSNTYLYEHEKGKYLRRMYSLTHFVKTLKENFSTWFNKTYDHQGRLWSDRFYSSIVQKTESMLLITSSYIDFNPVKANMVKLPEDYEWSSYHLAMSSSNSYLAQKAREGYEMLTGQKWNEAKIEIHSYYDKVRKTRIEQKNVIDDIEKNGLDKYKNLPYSLMPFLRLRAVSLGLIVCSQSYVNEACALMKHYYSIGTIKNAVAKLSMFAS